jgi:hypothetical protein
MLRPLATAAAVLLAALMLPLPLAGLSGPTEAEGQTSSALVPCSEADVRTTLTASAHLDPGCEYHAGFDITASNVVLDCQGARIKGSGGGRGIEIETPASVTMGGVTVRNCRTEGFLNGLRATRTGFRSLPEGHEFDNNLSGIVIEDSSFTDSIGVGVFVDGYVSDVTIARSVITGAGSTGIYLEAGSKDNTVVDNQLIDNGYRENGQGGSTQTFAGILFRYWGTGREGLAIDGSFNNYVARNYFTGNSNGGIFVYTNCGEYWQSVPARWYERRFGADDNLIESNRFEGGRHGVWVGARMGENTLPMECSDSPYIDAGGLWVTLDEAADNTVRGNEFDGVHYGVRVEDDGTAVEANTFTAPDASHHAVVVGTRYRTTTLDHPVTDTTLVGNTSTIVGNENPYRWIWGHEHTRVTGNVALGTPVGLCEGEPLPHTIFVMTLALAVQPPGEPPVPNPGVEYPLLGAIEACDEPSLTAPDAPTGVEAVPGPRQATVRWQPGFNDGGVPVRGYRVVDEHDQLMASTAASVTEVDVIGLDPSEPVSMRVVADNDVGESAPSATVGPITVSDAAPFADVTVASTYYDEINWLVARHLARGYADGSFRPAASLPRAEAAALLYRLAGEPPVAAGTPSFVDVGVGHVFFTEIEWAASEGLVRGFSNGSFGPTEPVTRGAVAALIHRFTTRISGPLPVT